MEHLPLLWKGKKKSGRSDGGSGTRTKTRRSAAAGDNGFGKKGSKLSLFLGTVGFSKTAKF